MPLESGDNVLIGGFIVTGNAPKKLILRAIDPSVTVGGAMQDPVIELYDGTEKPLATNDDRKSENQQAITDTTVPPSHDREAAIVGALEPGNYTAIVRGKNGGSGIGLVELYDPALQASRATAARSWPKSPPAVGSRPATTRDPRLHHREHEFESDRARLDLRLAYPAA